MKACSLLILFYLLSYSSTAQTNQPYKIAVYELCRSPKTWDDAHYTYQIRNLFMRAGDNWVANTNALKTQYYLLYSGKKVDSIKGVCCSETPNWWYQEFDSAKNSGRFLKPEHRITLTKNYITGPFINTDADLIKKDVLLTTNVFFKQQTRLQKYFSSQDEKVRLKDSVIQYLKALYVSNKACSESWQIDTLINWVLKPAQEVFIDSSSSFIDKHSNKIINLLVPVRMLYSNFYPFSGECVTEDSRQYFKILCYITNAGKISFIGDNLQYLDHGDFDNDGKDEFLFWTTRHNHDGYVMYYDDFKKMVKLSWSYH